MNLNYLYCESLNGALQECCNFSVISAWYFDFINAAISNAFLPNQGVFLASVQESLISDMAAYVDSSSGCGTPGSNPNRWGKETQDWRLKEIFFFL